MKPRVIAIDGPAAAGKSTVAERLARVLGYLYFDTGIMYRAITWVALSRHVPIADEAAITRLAETVELDILCQEDAGEGSAGASGEGGEESQEDGEGMPTAARRPCTPVVLADGEDITHALRRPEVDRNVSPVSAYPGVRAALTRQQRRIAQRGQVVMVGRDIGTVVAPDAELKIYLDATPEERARRRYQERLAKGQPADYEAILESMRRRDQLDSQREVAPLRPAEDAVIIDTTHMSVEQVLQTILRLIGDP